MARPCWGEPTSIRENLVELLDEVNVNTKVNNSINLSIQEQRKAGGVWLKSCRINADLSQKQLAEKVGADYYTFISQLENGRGRIPPDRYEDWAKAFGIPADEFVIDLMSYYDPVTFRILCPQREHQSHLHEYS